MWLGGNVASVLIRYLGSWFRYQVRILRDIYRKRMFRRMLLHIWICCYHYHKQLSALLYIHSQLQIDKIMNQYQYFPTPCSQCNNYIQQQVTKLPNTEFISFLIKVENELPSFNFRKQVTGTLELTSAGDGVVVKNKTIFTRAGVSGHSINTQLFTVVIRGYTFINFCKLENKHWQRGIRTILNHGKSISQRHIYPCPSCGIILQDTYLGIHRRPFHNHSHMRTHMIPVN